MPSGPSWRAVFGETVEFLTVLAGKGNAALDAGGFLVVLLVFKRFLPQRWCYSQLPRKVSGNTLFLGFCY
jgi:hypothetical protein